MRYSDLTLCWHTIVYISIVTTYDPKVIDSKGRILNIKRLIAGFNVHSRSWIRLKQTQALQIIFESNKGGSVYNPPHQRWTCRACRQNIRSVYLRCQILRRLLVKCSKFRRLQNNIVINLNGYNLLKRNWMRTNDFNFRYCY